MKSDKFYVTTPIYYVNDKPHIGHAYTTILADVLSRYHRALGNDVFFLTGLDDHGQKVKQAAEARGMTPLEHCNDLAPRFKNLWEKLEIKNDDFIETIEDRHKKVVSQILQKVYDNGDVYSDEYEGWYSVSEERFITETEKESGQFRDIKQLKERNWFFKMSKYQQKLIDHINQNPLFIQPEHRKNEILGFLRQSLGDLCISRPKSRMDWGIELPFDKEYVTYVWFDALINYITGIGYLQDNTKFNKWWPVDAHLIGKDILTTHCVYWTTMLFSIGLPLPKTIFAHGWWLIGDSKMSKSLGNVVSPLDLVDEYGVDPVRYYLMAEMVMGSDANFTMDSFIKRFNSDLANDFGNLLNRLSGLINKNFDGFIPPCGELNEEDQKIVNLACELEQKVSAEVKVFKIHSAIAAIFDLISKTNKYMEYQAPWKVAKEDKQRAGTILHVALEALRISAVLLIPVMPDKCSKVLDVISAGNSTPSWGQLNVGFKMQTHDALFPRLELDKK